MPLALAPDCVVRPCRPVSETRLDTQGQCGWVAQLAAMDEAAWVDVALLRLRIEPPLRLTR